MRVETRPPVSARTPGTTEALADFRLRTFRAIDDDQASWFFAESHCRVLHAHGINALHSADPKWLHLAIPGSVLPIEEAMREHDESVYEWISRQRRQPIGEIAGMWKTNDGDARGRPHIVSCLAVAVLAMGRRSGLHRLVGLSPAHTLKRWLRNGCRVQPSLGADRRFAYPDPRFVSRLLTAEVASHDAMSADVNRFAAEPVGEWTTPYGDVIAYDQRLHARLEEERRSIE